MSKSLDIQISTSEVIFRVQNVSHISSQVAEATKRLDAVAAPMVQADDDENNEALICDAIQAAIGTLQTALHEYISSFSYGEVDSLVEAIRNRNVLVFHFALTDNYQTNTIDAVILAMNDYIVNRTLAEWYTVADTSQASVYLEKANGNLVDLLKSIYRRKRPNRPLTK